MVLDGGKTKSIPTRLTSNTIMHCDNFNSDNETILDENNNPNNDSAGTKRNGHTQYEKKNEKKLRNKTTSKKQNKNQPHRW